MTIFEPAARSEWMWVVSCDGCPRCHLIKDAPAELLLGDPEVLKRRARQILAGQLKWMTSTLLDLCHECAARSWN